MKKTLSHSRKPHFLLLHALAAVAIFAALDGCVTKSQADAQARAAFLAGQQQAMTRAQTEPQPEGATVTLAGNVKNPLIPWTPGLTLAKAILDAQYTGKGDPVSIYVVHNGLASSVDPRKLLNGEDIPLQAGDIVQIK
jgi:hypothetical protein